MPSATHSNDSGNRHIEQSEPRMICSLEVGGGANQPDATTWSRTGQAAIILDAVIHIFTPKLGFHSNLKPNAGMNIHPLPTSDPSTSPSSTGTKSHSQDSVDPFDHYHWALDISNELAEATHRDVVSNDSLLPLPTLAAPQWRDACWSPPGFGPNGSCLLATLNSELEIAIYSAPQNPYLGPWIRDRQVDFDAIVSAGDRVKFLSTQPTTIFWSTTIPSTSTSTSDSQTSVLAAGTRIGELLIWAFKSDDFIPKQTLRLYFDSGYISQLVISDWFELGETFFSRLAIFGERKLVIVKISFVDGILEEEEIEHQVTIEPQQISCALWMDDDRIVFSTPGEIHCLDLSDPSRGIRTVDLEDGKGARANPYASAIAITSLSLESFEVTLQEGSVYEVKVSDFDPKSKKHGTIQPVTIQSKSTLRIGTGTGKIRDLQHQLESFQTIQAFKPDLSSDSRDSSARLYAVLQTAEENAAWRYKLNASSTFGLVLRNPSSIETAAKSLLSQSFSVISLYPDLTPIHAMRTLLALYTASDPSSSGQILAVINEELKMKVKDIETNPSPQSANSISKGKEREFVTWLAQWSEAQPSSSRSSPSLSERALKAQVSYISQSRLDDALEYYDRNENSMDEDTEEEDLDLNYPLRLCASSFLSSTSESQDQSLRNSIFNLLSKFKGEKESKRLEKEWLGILNDEEDEEISLNVDEKCPACEAEISLKKNSDGIATCLNGHVWQRCSITLKVLNDPNNIRTCVGCWSKSLQTISNVEGDQKSSLAQETLKKAERCQSCGNAWVLIL